MNYAEKIVDFLDSIGKGIGSEAHVIACQFAAFLDRLEPQAEAEQIVSEPAPEPTPEPTPEPAPEPAPEVPAESTIETPVEGQ